MVEQETQRKQRRKLSEIIRENLQKITIVLISFVYIIQGMFQLKQKNTTVLNILGSIGISIIVGFVIANNMRSMGLRDGRRSEIFINSVKAYGKAKEEATPNFDSLSAWCEYKNAQELEYKRKSIIQGVGLNWKAYKLGYYNDEEHYAKLNEKQTQAIENAQNCQIYRIYSQEILSDLPSAYGKNGNRFGESQKEYVLKRSVIDILSRLCIGVVCGMYSLYPLFTGENAAQVIAGVVWNTLQIIIFLAFGLVKYADAKSFIEDDYRQTHIIQKTELLNEFVVTMKNNPSVITTYEEDLELDEYINEYINMKQKIKSLEVQEVEKVEPQKAEPDPEPVIEEEPKQQEEETENGKDENEQEGVLD